ncbi:hypothetical protein WJX72_012454 [[Myrmecia] bisecta]|uniref:Lumazine-binding domain-containing protein n=1 Tax=[Myrmecia] bisecta TaxID=41462 RepID=A0AAW1Q8V4_9CHLO
MTLQPFTLPRSGAAFLCVHSSQAHTCASGTFRHHRRSAVQGAQLASILQRRQAGVLQLQARGRQQQHPSRPHVPHTQAVFTGIVQGQGKVIGVHKQKDFSSIQIEFPAGSMDSVQIGASVAINGTCLTVTKIERDVLQFDIIVETLRATSLGQLREGSHVNFERAARIGDEIGGHNVSGHVHTTARIASIEQTDNNRKISFQVPEQWMKYILPKGFIAVDGTSLTVGEVGADWFTVYLIPETLRVTVLGSKVEGDLVNIEIESQTQAIVDTVEKVVAQYLASQGIKPPTAEAGAPSTPESQERQITFAFSDQTETP